MSVRVVVKSLGSSAQVSAPLVVRVDRGHRQATLISAPLVAADLAPERARLAALEANQLPVGQPGDILVCGADGHWEATDVLPT